jgi:phage terminase small subunit
MSPLTRGTTGYALSILKIATVSSTCKGKTRMKVHKVRFDDPHPDLIGKKYGTRTVVSFAGVNNDEVPVYRTVCECGKKSKLMYDTIVMNKLSFCSSCVEVKEASDAPYDPQGRADPETGLNPQQELFCQEYVLCWNPYEASKAVGYTASNGTTLMANKNVQRRIDELIVKARRRQDEALENLPKDMKMDLARVTRMLLHDREAALTGRVRLRGKEPEPVPSNWKMDNRAAVQATMGIAQLHGLLIKRTEVTIIDAMAGMNDQELLDFVNKMQAKLSGVITIDAIPNASVLKRADEPEEPDEG